MSSSAAQKALEASGGSILFAEELTANTGQSYALEDLNPEGRTVRDLRLSIAQAIKDRSSWSTLQVIFAGEVMEDQTRWLSEYGIHNGDTVYFIRSVTEAPPPYYGNPDAMPSKAGASSEKSPETAPVPALRETTITIKTLFFKDLDGKSLTLTDVDVDTRMSDVFRRLGEEKAMDVEWLRFIWSGKQLNGDKTIRDYGIMNESTIHILYNIFTHSVKMMNRLNRFRVDSLPTNNSSSNNSGQTVEQLTGRLQALDLRVHELTDQLEEQTSFKNQLSVEVRRLEEAKAENQIRHAMRVSDLEHQLMVMKQQLWLAEDAASSSVTSTSATRPAMTITTTTRPTSVSSTYSRPTSTTTTVPGRSLSPQSSASLEAERTRRGELESQVAVLRTQLNDERRRQATRDREHRGEVVELQKQLNTKSAALAAKDAELGRINALLADNANNSQQHTSQLQTQIAEEAARRQRAVDRYETQRAADQRAIEALQLEKNVESGKRMAAERRVQHLREEVARRGQQLEYYQQRLLRTAEFRVVKTPFEQEGGLDVPGEEMATAAGLSTPPGSPSPTPAAAATPADTPAADATLPTAPTTIITPAEPAQVAELAN
ncbi:hypothetical protein SBRCBS47491_007576 [Sporothrix bragantina]|uniref:Ubiquitin-like domain-containing protein n=1 Tax=Sporothrix bragantina TaxID=671064 RepID=A0ABP0CFM0_9PEZI